MINPESLGSRIEARKEALKKGTGELLRDCVKRAREAAAKIVKGLVEAPYYGAAAVIETGIETGGVAAAAGRKAVEFAREKGEMAVEFSREKAYETVERIGAAKDRLVDGVRGAVNKAAGKIESWRDKVKDKIKEVKFRLLMRELERIKNKREKLDRKYNKIIEQMNRLM